MQIDFQPTYLICIYIIRTYKAEMKTGVLELVFHWSTVKDPSEGSWLWTEIYKLQDDSFSFLQLMWLLP